MATLTLTIRGEGRTPDAATASLAAKQKAVIAGLLSLDRKIDVRTGSISISEAHSGDCDNRDDHILASDAEIAMAQHGGGKGICVVTGRIAEIETTIIMSSVKDAGTAVGLAGRLGAREAKVENFGIHDEADATNRAVAQAIGSARAQARAIAAAAGAKLGPLVSVTDGSDDTLHPAMISPMVAAPPPPDMPPPIAVDIVPKPVETSARLTVTFAIER
jgi:uncharacterized protein YggE